MPEPTPLQPKPQEDVVIATLKKRYFELAVHENYPHTPKVTAEVDHLEHAIRVLKNKGTTNPV